ncbi:hypothetical protein Tco_0379192 [Tanacetum coccineum]
MAEGVIDLDVVGTLQFQLGAAKRPTGEGFLLRGDFLGTSPSYTLIRDPLLRLCHRLITCSIVRRSQAHEKYLRRYSSGRKHGAMISGGQPHVVAGALVDVKGAYVEVKGIHAILALVQAPQPLPIAA